MSFSNMSIRQGNNGTEVFYSYATPVAIKDEEGRIYKTDSFYSVTTSKHINKYVAGRYADKVSQEVIDNFVKNT